MIELEFSGTTLALIKAWEESALSAHALPSDLVYNNNLKPAKLLDEVITMVSEIDLLRNDIPRLEEKFGRGNPFIEVLKADLIAQQNSREADAKSRLYLGLSHFKRHDHKKKHGLFKKPH